MLSQPWTLRNKQQHSAPPAATTVGSAPKRLAVLVNIVAPYRLPLYAALSEQFETVVFHGGYEPNRDWRSQSGSAFQTRKVWTIQMPARKTTGSDGICDISYIHFNLGLLWELPKYRPDVLISNELGLRTMIAVLYSRVANIPLWVWWGGTVHSERNISINRRFLRSVLKAAVRRWISYGETSTEYLESLEVPREHILQIQNCVPQESFALPPADPGKWFPDSPSPVLISTGQLIERKGMNKLIEACGRLQARGHKFTLVLVGSGCEYDNLQELAKANQLEHFHILPEQPQRILNQLYRRADAFVFPTLEDVWGLVVNEALWAGCPVLCSVYAGCAPELVPEANRFDPLSSESFDVALGKVLTGAVVPASASIKSLRTHQQVSTDIVRSLHAGAPGLSEESLP